MEIISAKIELNSGLLELARTPLLRKAGIITIEISDVSPDLHRYSQIPPAAAEKAPSRIQDVVLKFP